MLDQSKVKVASDYFLNQEYDLAADVYQDLSKDSPNNPYLLANLGVSKYENNEYGEALQNLYQAKKILPRNKTINNNINLIENKMNLTKPNLFSYNFISLNEALLILLIFNLIFIFRSFISKNKYIKRIISICFMLMVLFCGFVYYEQELKSFGIITNTNATAYSGDSEEYSELFELLSGQIIEVKMQHTNWYQIKFQNQLAWVKGDSIGII